jgi:hypothetical protein
MARVQDPKCYPTSIDPKGYLILIMLEPSGRLTSFLTGFLARSEKITRSHTIRSYYACVSYFYVEKIVEA